MLQKSVILEFGRLLLAEFDLEFDATIWSKKALKWLSMVWFLHSL